MVGRDSCNNSPFTQVFTSREKAEEAVKEKEGRWYEAWAVTE